MNIDQNDELFSKYNSLTHELTSSLLLYTSGSFSPLLAIVEVLVSSYMKKARFGTELKTRSFAESVLHHIALVINKKTISFDMQTCLDLTPASIDIHHKTLSYG